MRRVLNVRSACSLPKISNSKATSFTLFTDRWRRWRWLVDEGRSLSMMSHVFVLFTDLYNQWLRFVHSITKKQGTLVMAITHSFSWTYESILTTDGSIRIAIFIHTVYCGCSEATIIMVHRRHFSRISQKTVKTYQKHR